MGWRYFIVERAGASTVLLRVGEDRSEVVDSTTPRWVPSDDLIDLTFIDLTAEERLGIIEIDEAGARMVAADLGADGAFD